LPLPVQLNRLFLARLRLMKVILVLAVFVVLEGESPEQKQLYLASLKGKVVFIQK
jgi:hypothetical protein